MGARRLPLLLLAAACSSAPATKMSPLQPPAPSPGPPSGRTTPGPSARVTSTTLADVGLEPASLDRKVDPCSDFFQYACGGWIAANPIPADHASWDRFAELEERTAKNLQVVLDAAAKTTNQLGDYYASCMDDSALQKAGTRSIATLLTKTRNVTDKSWLAVVGELHLHGVPVVWGISADPDFKDSTRYVTALDTAGLGLPDRDYYVNPALASQVEGYQQHVGRMLGLAGIAKSDAAAADVVAIETALAKLTKTRTERRDLQGIYNPTDLAGLGASAKSIDWNTYFKLVGITPSARIVVSTPALFAALDNLRKQFKPAQWASYFTYHLVVSSAVALPKAFDDEAFTLEKLVTGVTEKRPRYKRCIESTRDSLGELLGRVYVEKYFPPTAKQRASELVDAIMKVMGEHIAKLDWMTARTKATAQDKLAKVVRMIGYPDKWRTYDVSIKRNDFGGNRLRAAAAETRFQLSRSGKPVDRAEWLMQTYEINAYYNPNANNTALLAAVLQPPFFGENRSIPANMGAIGMFIGHELTHAFDDQGAQFDSAGNLVNWWAKADQDAFDVRGKCVVDQYSTFEAAPKELVNGKLTLGENIADLGGIKMAFKAYRAMLAGAETVSVADGFTEDQQFFLGLAQAWCGQVRPAELVRRLTTDPHSPNKLRVYGMLRNLPEFATAFSCAPKTPMRPAQTCSVW
jgi:putative endopeptidase